jgi:hypothetical protein
MDGLGLKEEHHQPQTLLSFQNCTTRDSNVVPLRPNELLVAKSCVLVSMCVHVCL